MIIIGVDFHPEFQQIALLDADSGEFQASSEYGADRVTHLVRQQAAKPPAELIGACLDDLRVFEAGGGPRQDDLTLLAIRRCD
jgi:serine phosphatase RsbU (regulator of sigma subunit)